MPKYQITLDTLLPTDAQFLKKYALSIDDVFDARTSSRQDREEHMSDANKLLALMFSCERCVDEQRGIRHLRTKYGHCVYCNKCAITFIQNRNKSGYVYIAGSISKKLIKIGSAGVPFERQHSLNLTNYGGVNDWFIIAHSKKIDAAGKFEAQIQWELKDFRSPQKWIRQGQEKETPETFQCSFTDAQKAFNKYLSFGCIPTRTNRYEF